MSQLFHHLHMLLFILPFMLVGCDKPFKKTCDVKCQKCIADCYKECEASFNSCIKAATPNNRSTYENCIYYGNQCLQNCQEKCMIVKEENPKPIR